jgi:hypothetical protein
MPDGHALMRAQHSEISEHGLWDRLFANGLAICAQGDPK